MWESSRLFLLHGAAIMFYWFRWCFSCMIGVIFSCMVMWFCRRFSCFSCFSCSPSWSCNFLSSRQRDDRTLKTCLPLSVLFTVTAIFKCVLWMQFLYFNYITCLCWMFNYVRLISKKKKKLWIRLYFYLSGKEGMEWILLNCSF